MQRRTRTAGLGLSVGVVALGGLSGTTLLQPEESGAQVEAVEAPDMPGEHHLGLAGLAGEWSSVSAMSMPDAEGGEQAPGDAGTVTIESILDGRFISIRESGMMMGEPFESLKVFGFNNAAGFYESTWLYTGSTAMMRMRGAADEGGHVITFQAQYATAPEENQRFLVTLSVHNRDEFVVTLVALLPDGSAGPSLETTYSRLP